MIALNCVHVFRFRSPSTYLVSDEPFPGRSRPMSWWLAKMGSRPITFLWLWPVTDNGPHCWHVPINKTWRWTESAARSGWRCSHMAGIYSDCSTREINSTNNRLVHSTWTELMWTEVRKLELRHRFSSRAVHSAWTELNCTSWPSYVTHSLVMTWSCTSASQLDWLKQN